MKKLSIKASPSKTTKNNHKSPDRYLAQPYARILIPDANGGFSAELLEFPGCFAEGIPPPTASYGYSGRLVLRLPRELHRLASRKANRDRVSLNQCLVTAIAAWVGADNLYQRLADRLERISASHPSPKMNWAAGRVGMDKPKRRHMLGETEE